MGVGRSGSCVLCVCVERFYGVDGFGSCVCGEILCCLDGAGNARVCVCGEILCCLDGAGNARVVCVWRILWGLETERITLDIMRIRPKRNHRQSFLEIQEQVENGYPAHPIANNLWNFCCIRFRIRNQEEKK
ncbi:hypothetical protein HNY73_008240 [Argiope bruennichi]|uniref:Uncharacterized protein n=1 Tax=Argiope bruennichi TaxID=94029 RepID=A0A8T0F828_ARGBR|nr:hypothetical protein HNY73_008240 [Argiope bruennichi]